MPLPRVGIGRWLSSYSILVPSRRYHIVILRTELVASYALNGLVVRSGYTQPSGRRSLTPLGSSIHMTSTFRSGKPHISLKLSSLEASCLDGDHNDDGNSPGCVGDQESDDLGLANLAMWREQL